MKRGRFFVLILALFFALMAFSGCTALKATSQAKEMMEEYFNIYNDEDIDDCIDMFGDEIIDDVDGEDAAEIIFTSRRYILGEVEDYEIVSFDSDGSFGEAQVVLEVQVTYENINEPINEEYLFYLVDKEMEIAGIDFGETTYPLADQIIAEYFEDYDDMQHVKKYYIPYVIENLFYEDSVQLLADFAYDVGGEYKGHEVTVFEYYYDNLTVDDDIYLLATMQAEMEFENEDFLLYAEISCEDDEVGLNYLEFYPQSPYEIIEEYFENIEKGDTQSIMDMYSPIFFQYSDYSPAEWDEDVLQYLVTGFGDFMEYTMLDWDYEVLTINDEELPVYSFSIVTEYEGAYIDEYISIIAGKSDSAVVGHQLEVEE